VLKAERRWRRRVRKDGQTGSNRLNPGADTAQRHLAERFERGKLSFIGTAEERTPPRLGERRNNGFTGDVLQVISVFGRRQ
jgi:hypothetical protein